MIVICNSIGSTDECRQCGASKPHSSSSCEQCPINKEAACIDFDTVVRAGCIALHKPTGEKWMVLGVNRHLNKCCIAGWPPTIANLSDMELIFEFVHKLDENELDYRKRKFGTNWES